MPSCVIKGCKRTEIEKTVDGITLHMVPKNIVKRELWCNVIRQLRNEPDWNPSAKRHFICSKHFRPEDRIHNPGSYIKLKEDAVPFFPRCNKEIAGTSVKSESPVDISDDPSSPLSDLDKSIKLVDPNEVDMEYKLRIAKGNINDLKNKINDLYSKNRVLQARCETLSKVILGVKKKFDVKRLNEKNLRTNGVFDDIYNKILKKKAGVTKGYGGGVLEFAAVLHSISPEAYEYVRDVCEQALPHPTYVSRIG